MLRRKTGPAFWLVTALFALSAAFIGCGGGGGGGGGDSAPAVTVPGAPTSVTANAGDNAVTVDWSPVAGADSYNIYRGTAPGVTKTTGTKIAGVTSPKDVTSLANGTKYYFVVTAVNANGESAESAEVFATPVAPSAAFSQADLAGTWDAIFFHTGSDSGWARYVITINSSGALTVTSGLNDSGNTTVPSAGSVIWAISAAGVVSEGGSSANASFHGQMSSNKQLVIGKEGDSVEPTVGLRVFRKRTGTVFTSADLANKTFTAHGLRSGTDNNWQYAAGTTDGSGLVTITSEVHPSGPIPPPGTGGTLSVSSTGIVTIDDDATWYGLMTDDKKVIFVIDGGSNNVGLNVITITGQTYTQSDYAGTWNFATIRNTVPNPYWNYGVASVDAAGNGTYLSFTDILGSPTPAAYIRVLSSSGVITDPANATAHGQLSYNENISVRTQTTSGRYQMTLGFK